ncbi:MAG: type II secretion system protein GspG [Candidatus Wallbacteria bacterium]|nr:type II secretion system protein GspG [Candidatus Wallbacteria bacterium]
MIVGGFLLGIELLNISLFSCCCCGSLPEGQVTKARQDLDTLAMAARLYESRFKALRGNDLKQLLGTVMQDIPQDPWGFPYHLDSVRGTMSSLGADGLPGGTDQDADIEYRFR